MQALWYRRQCIMAADDRACAFEVALQLARIYVRDLGLGTGRTPDALARQYADGYSHPKSLEDRWNPVPPLITHDEAGNLTSHVRHQGPGQLSIWGRDDEGKAVTTASATVVSLEGRLNRLIEGAPTVEGAPTDTACQGALCLILAELLRTGADIPQPLRNWGAAFLDSTTRSTRHGGSKGLSASSSFRRNAVGKIVSLIAAEPTVRGLSPTRNVATKPHHSICDAVQIALAEEGWHLSYETISADWKASRRQT